MDIDLISLTLYIPNGEGLQLPLKEGIKSGGCLQKIAFGDFQVGSNMINVGVAE